MNKIISFQFTRNGEKYYTLDENQILKEYDLFELFNPTVKNLCQSWDLGKKK